jgi:hypothetical protein
MAIIPIGGNGVTTGAVSGLTESVTYSPTLGNTIVAFLSTNGAVTGIVAQDNLANNLTAGPTIGSAGSTIYSFYYPSVPTGVTSYTFTWTTSRISRIVIQEYSGATAGVNASLVGNTAGATSALATITVTLDEAADYVVFGFHGSNGLTVTNGNLRQSTGGSPGSSLIVDCTSFSLSSVTASATLTSSAWAIIAIELRVPPSPQIFLPPAITSEYHWGGGTGW